ncbi:tubulin monoglutamylase TTLL4 [Anarrhichthys ocellatus]|uniref:tubulin monoglutamylase TTLL4 n=1 Tax=Anarrhichthys ocellatus TaxID=433405 RepID=UPI0012EE44A0|nr:tubulin polyglutamylase TTLL4 [Anarrhichthys ocellatus]XP_031729865.1 tubulin polyglutamylase TTLL4 [Anarrhichthys ocellatus]XP_031729866.1 tubulin polyglutamylase TTLL4 [Anarrhichthys ocellatus]
MPTNQSSPWDGAKLRPCSNADSPTTTTSVSTHAEAVVATKVPFSPTSLELSRRKDQAKPPLSSDVASSASPLRQTTVAPSVCSVEENGYRNKTNAQSQFTTVPDGSPNLPQQLNGIQNPHQILKQAASSLTEPSAPSFIPTEERQIGIDVQPTGSTQKGVSLQTSQPGSGVATSRRRAATADVQLGRQILSSVCFQDLFIEGQPALQQPNKMMPEAGDSSCLPSVPPLCLTLCDHHGAPPRTDASSTEIRSTTRETAATRRSQSAKVPKCSPPQNISTTTTASNNQLVVRGGPLAATTNSKPLTIASLDLNKKGPDSQCPPGSTLSTCRRVSLPEASPCPDGPPPTVLSANVSATPLDATAAAASGPAGASLGSVTTQISAIHLTGQDQPASGSASPPLPSTPSPTEDCLVGETRLSGHDCVMQVDGVEEELPDELENACSDDDDSDCSSIDGTSSTASIAPLSGVEEPMSLGAEDDREERPALVPSLFAFIAPTLYFSTADEKVELLPAEQRRLLKWKISTVTPNIVKHTIGRSHFKVTKKSHDWLGCWGHHMKSPGFKALGEHQKLNHFPGTFQIGRKDRLWRNLSKMQVRFGKQEFSFFPRTFVLPQDMKLLRKAWEDGGSRQKWIIKPPASARGIGIQVIHRWSQMPRKRPLLVQKYLHKPYLISGNKFDLRIYVYVSCYDPLRIYIFSDGLVRFASCKYSSSMKTLGNKFMHLTNYSVNKKNSEYQTNSDDKACQGHKWALKALWQYLGSKGVNTTLIWEKIKDIVIKTIIGSEPYVNSLLKMHVRAPYSCHELFGFDIMLDEKLKPWILEVNISPSLHSNTALDVAVKGQMIRDLLNLAGFRIPQKEDVVASCSSASSSTSSLCVATRERTKPNLSADEKVKRAFYLAQHYAEQDFLSTVLDVLTPEDVRVLAESEDELTRLGQFERIFPSPASSRYLRFFECPRYFNVLLDQWEQKYWSNRTKGISLLTSLCEKGVHLGTSDPLHTWSKCSYISSFEPHKQNLIGPSRSRVVVTHQHRSHHDDYDDGSDTEAASVSSPTASPSPGSSLASSACASPQPGLTQSLPPHQFASL